MPALRSLRTVVFALLAVVIVMAGTASAADVSVTAGSVEPNPAAATVGEAVTFTNDTGEPLRLIDDGGRWDSGELAPGQTFQITFNEAGIFRFSSEDGSVTGAIEVTSAEGTGDVDPEASATDAAGDEADDDDAGDEDATDDDGTGDDGTGDDAAGDGTGDDGPDPDAEVEPEAGDAAAPETLAATGISAGLLTAAGVAAFLIGVVLLLRTRRN